MSAHPDVLDLGRLDQARPHDPPAQIWSDNLAALRASQPGLAFEIANLSLPDTWRPVLGLDDTPTWRIEPPGQPPQWLAGSAAPGSRAAALLRDVALADRNPALASLGAGAELRLLLDRLARWQAVYVFEENLLVLAAVLRTVPLAAALADGRCVLVPPRQEEQFLIELLERQPGMLPPGNLICLPIVPRPRLDELRSLCERVAQRVSGARTARLDSLRSQTARVRPGTGRTPRLASAALSPDPLAHWLAGRLRDCARSLDWAAVACVMDRPNHVGPLPHAEQLRDLGPNLIICVNHAPAWLPLKVGATICQWHLNEYDVPVSLPAEDDTLHLAASPRIARALSNAAAPPTRIVEFFHAVPHDAFAAPPEAATSCVWIIGDLPDPRPVACGIEHSSHRHLWEVLGRVVAAAWERGEPFAPEALLRSAERSSGVEISASSLRQQWLMLTERVLIPSVALEAAAGIAASAGLEIGTVGTGWPRLNNPAIRVLAAGEAELPALTAPRPLAVIFAGRPDPVSFALTFVAAAGYPVLLHGPRGASLHVQLGPLLRPEEHVATFAGPRELRLALAALQTNPAAALQRAQRAREHVRAHHTLRSRLQRLAERLPTGREGGDA